MGRNTPLFITYKLSFNSEDNLSKEKLEKFLDIIHTQEVNVNVRYVFSREKIDILISSPKEFNIKEALNNSLGPTSLSRTNLKDLNRPKYLKLKKHYSYPLNISKDTDINKILISKLLNNKKNLSFIIDLQIKPNNSIKNIINRNQILNLNKKHYLISDPLWSLNELLYIYKLLSLIYKKYINNNYENIKYIEDSLRVLRLDKMYSRLFNVKYSVIADDNNLIENYIQFINSDSNQKIKTSEKSKQNILSSFEISDILKIPMDPEIHDLLDINKIHAITPNILFTKNINTVVGLNNKYIKQEIGLNLHNKQKHTLILGATGSGKSTLLKNIFNQDIKNNHGITLIDPHGDLARDIFIDNKEVKDIIYFDPLISNIRINLLERYYSKSDYRYNSETELIIDNLISVLSKLFSNESKMGHKIEYLIRNTALLALEQDNPNLSMFYEILQNLNYRNKLINSSNNLVIKEYFVNEFNKAGDYQRVKMVSGVTSKIGRLLNSPLTSKIFNCNKSNLDFRNIINNKSKLICNLSKGNIGEHNSNMLGTVIIAKLHQASYSFSNLKPADRTDHYLYIDEFANFVTPSFRQMVSESRKYKTFLYLSEQSLYQQDEETNNIILSNVGNIISFRTSSTNEAKKLEDIFHILKYRDFINLPNHYFYLITFGYKKPIFVNGEVIN